MALAIAMGHCHEDLRERIGMAQTVEEEDVLLAGAWDLDPGEAERLAASRVAALPVEDVPANAELLARRVEQVYVHVDADVLDRTPPETLVAVFERLLAAAPVETVAIANYNPERDPGGRVERAALDLLRALAGTLESGE
jgi:arginase family enzyme